MLSLRNVLYQNHFTTASQTPWLGVRIGQYKEMGRILISAGILLVCAGLVVMFLERMHVSPGRLPGDVVWRGKHTTVYFPWVTCLLLSAIATVLLWLFNRR